MIASIGTARPSPTREDPVTAIVFRAMRLAFFTALALSAACGGSDTVPTAPSASTTITAKANYTFSPNWTAVPVGSTVTFTFEGVAHAPTISGALGAPANIPPTSNASVRRVFTTKGVFNYTCSVHAFMTGRITVQ
jgi:plastocyanin